MNPQISHNVIAKTIIPGLLNGETQTQIAKKAGCSQPQISNLKKELKEKLERFQLDMINHAGEKAVNNTILTIHRANSVLDSQDINNKDISDYKALLELSHKKEVLIGQSMGIFPSHTENTYIQTIIMKQQLIINDPTALKAIGKYVDDDIIDIDLGLDG